MVKNLSQHTYLPLFNDLLGAIHWPCGYLHFTEMTPNSFCVLRHTQSFYANQYKLVPRKQERLLIDLTIM
jgi:hypothetical protein